MQRNVWRNGSQLLDGNIYPLLILSLIHISMPIMAPLADLLGVSRQTSVLAFQLGDAFTNLIVPTSGCLIGSLAIAKIEWSNWIKFMWKFLGILMIGAVITILIAVAIGF